MEEFINNETMDTAVAVVETATEVAPSFLEKHGKDLAKMGAGAAIGGAVTFGAMKLVGWIKKKVADRKARKAAAMAEPAPQDEAPVEEAPEEK